MTDSVDEFVAYSRDFAMAIRAVSKIVTMPASFTREVTGVPVEDLKAMARVITYQTQRIAELEAAREHRP